MKSIEQRLNDLEQLLDKQYELRTLEKQRGLTQEARLWASLSIIRELAIEAGLSSEEYAKHFERRKQYFHDQLLQTAEKVSDRRAAELDIRDIKEVPTEKGYPPLFKK